MTLLGLVPGLVVPHTASSAPQPTCVFWADLVLDPGLSSVPSSGTFETAPDQAGTYRCRAFGSEKSGPAGTSGRYGTSDEDSCSEGGEGEGDLRFGDSGADSGGNKTDYTFAYSAFSEDGVAVGEFHSDRFKGTFTLTAKNGDCALARITQVHLEGEGTITP
jgi:hypothetical protein